MGCCSRLCLLSVLMLSSWALHVLIVLLAVAVFYDEREKMDSPPTLEMIMTVAHHLEVGVVGLIANSVALVRKLILKLCISYAFP